MSTLFSKILNGEIKGTIVYQDEHCAVLQDIQPAAPTHLLVIPKKEIPSVDKAQGQDKELLGHLILTAAQIARDHGVAQSGYRLVINIGEDAGMSVPHLHIHLLGGRRFTWPPG